MRQEKLDILSNEQLTSDIFRMWLTSDKEDVRATFKEIKAGQFINIAIEGCYLRRPISICDLDDKRICIVYKVVGKGTKILSEMQPTESLDVLLPLGNGFDLEFSGERPLLIGGGVGVPPLLLLAKHLISQGKLVDVILGFNKRQDIILENEFRDLGCQLTIATVDGSVGNKGFVTDAIKIINANNNNSCFYACGPMPMLRALHKELTIDGQMSLEERMGCGFGVCVGCTCNTKNGWKQVCTDGPVFNNNELIF